MRKLKVRVPKDMGIKKAYVPDMERAHKSLEKEKDIGAPDEVVVIYGKEEITYVRK